MNGFSPVETFSTGFIAVATMVFPPKKGLVSIGEMFEGHNALAQLIVPPRWWMFGMKAGKRATR